MMDRPDWAVEGRDWPNRAASRFVKVAGLTWHVQVAGTGPVLLLLHGTGAATHSWREVLPMLADAFTVVAPDLPGHGFTRGLLPQGATLPNVSRAVAELAAALQLVPDMIVGHSAGAAIAVRMALDKACAPRAIVALSPALMPFPGLAAQLFPTLAKLLFVNPFAPYLFAQLARSRGEVGRFLTRSTGSALDNRGLDLYTRLFRRAGHVQGTISLMANWDLVPLYDALPGLMVPLMIAHGANDAAIPIGQASEVSQRVPGAHLERLTGLGHLAHEEQPALAAQIIRQSWLEHGGPH